MVRIHELSQSLGGPEEIGFGFGQGLTEGLSQGVQSFYNQKKRIEEGRPQVQKYLSEAFKFHNLEDAYDEGVKGKLLTRAQELFEKSGLDPYLASQFALEEYKQGQNQQTSSINGENGTQSSKADRKKPKTRKEAIQELYSQPFNGPQLNQDFRGADKGQFSNPETLKQLLSGSLEGATAGLADIAPPQTGLGRGFRTAGDLVGALLPFKGLGLAAKGLGIAGKGAVPLLQRAALAGGFGAAASAGRQAIKGEEVTPGRTALGAAGWAAAEPLGLLLGKAIQKIPGVWKALRGASKAANVPEQKIIQEAAQNLESRGVDVVQAAQGDAASLNALQKEVSNVSKTYQEAAKFNQKELEKIRADVSKKLPESPLEKYYEPKKEVVSRPETIAKEELRTAPLKNLVKENEKKLLDLQVAILSGENALRRAPLDKLAPEAIQRIESNLALNNAQKNKILNEIRSGEFEIKYKRPPHTEESIKEQIQKSFSELKEGIKDPQAEKLVKVREKLETDKSAIEVAEKLVSRGEIPGPEVFDEFIKIHKQYNAAYNDLINELKDYIKSSQASKSSAIQARVQNAKELKNVIEQVQKVNEAKLINHADKRKAMKILDKPSGAFYKTMLRDLKKDVADFQKQFFKVKDIKSTEEAVVSSVGRKGASESGASVKSESKLKLGDGERIAKEASSAVKNPSKENIEKLAETSGIDKQETHSFIQGLKDEAKKLSGKIEGGTASEKDIQNLGKRLMGWHKKLGKIPKAAVNGLIAGTVQAMIEEYFDYKVPVGLIGLFGPGNALIRGSSAGLGTIVNKLITSAFENSEAKKLRKLRNGPEFNKYVKDLKTRYNEKKVNKIVKKATANH